MLNKKNRYANKNIIHTINELVSRFSNLLAIAGSIFAIFVLLMQIRSINAYNFYIANYGKIINIITICFIFILLEQIRIAPRKLYIIVPIIQIIGLILINFLSKKYYNIYKIS